MLVSFFSLVGVDVHVVDAGVLADDHALVDLGARRDEHRAALLQVGQREAGRRAAAVGDQRAGRAGADVAVPRLVALVDVVQQAGAAGLGEELGAEADQAAGRDDVLHPGPAGAVVDHLLEPALAQRHELDDARPGSRSGVSMVRRSIGSCILPSTSAGDDLRLADGELEALAAHDLDEDRQLQLAAALHLPGVGALGGLDADRDVADQLLVEPVLDHAGGELLAALAGQRAGVDADRHRDVRARRW